LPRLQKSLLCSTVEEQQGSANAGKVQVKHFVSKFEYSASRVIPAAAPRTPKNRRKEGGNFLAQFAVVSKKWAKSLKARQST
jgi:hypothetical protein